MVSVSSANIDALKGMPDVEFDFGVSSALKASFRAEASRLQGQRGTRATARTTGLTDFKGHFSEVFRTNGVTQLNDLDEVAGKLRQVATEVERLEEAARAENERRKTARDWAQRQADRSGFDTWVDDHITGGEDPPEVNLSDSGPSASVAQPAGGPRQTPTAGGGGGGGGTSSARPADLRTFATTSAQEDTALTGLGPAPLRPLRRLRRLLPLGDARRERTRPGPARLAAAERRGRQLGDHRRRRVQGAGSEGDVTTLSDATVEAALRAANVPVTRRDLDVDPPTAYGSPPTTGYADDPVNTASGNFTETESDLDFSGTASVAAAEPDLQLAGPLGRRLRTGLDLVDRGAAATWTPTAPGCSSRRSRDRLPAARHGLGPRHRREPVAGGRRGRRRVTSSPARPGCAGGSTPTGG